jgi:hypothetical protein
MKIFFGVILISFIVCNTSFSQQTSTPKTFMDKLQEIIEVRQAFDTKSETKKPAKLSFKKNENEDAVYTIDLAVIYKGFERKTWGISPAVQLEYSSNLKDKQQTFKGGLLGFVRVLEFPRGYIDLEPSTVFTRDFFYKTKSVDTKLYINPTFPQLFIPIRDVSEIQLNYTRDDGAWLFGFNPVAGIEYRISIDDTTPTTDVNLFDVFAGEITLKRPYIEFGLNGRYEQELEKNKNSTYRYGIGMIVYFDSKERSSFNTKFEREEKQKSKTYKITAGIGVKL